MTVWHICNAYLITVATNTCSECVILIAFAWQQWLHQRASLLTFIRYHVHCLSYVSLSLCLPGNVIFAFKLKLRFETGCSVRDRLDELTLRNNYDVFRDITVFCN